MDRKGLAVKSSVIGLISKLLSSLLAFVCRKYFLIYLGTGLLGVSNTLTQVLDTLSLTELGFQTAIIFQLYKPLVDNNRNEISKIMMLLKKVYSYIGVIVLVIGLLLTPFVKNIITRVDVDFGLVYIVYFIMLIGTASSYFLSYNRALLQADQKIYINNLLDSAFQIIISIGKLVSIIVFQSFILYAVIGTLGTIGSNVASYIYYKRQYPWIDTKVKAEKEIIKNLVSNTKDVFVGRIAGYVYSSTDNLVISAFVGTGWVGLVGNYSTITSAIKMIIFGLTGPIQPILGNFAVSKSKDEAERTMFNYGFIRLALASFLIIPTMCLSDMFVGLFYGEQFVQNPIIIILLSADLFIICMQGAIGEMIDALGFFKQERNMYIVYAVMNLVLSCFGAKIWGVVPVFAATVLSQMTGWMWRSVIAYRHYFSSKRKFFEYWIIQGKYIIFYCFTTFISFIFVNSMHLPKSYFCFVIYGMCIEVLIGILFIIVFRNCEEYKYLMCLLKKLIRRS